MATFLLKGNYSKDGMVGLMKEGASGRLPAIEALVDSVGGKIISLYYAFGDTDIIAIAEFPDNATAAAVSMMVNASGATTITTEALMTVAEIDEAAKKSPAYRAPGQ